MIFWGCLIVVCLYLAIEKLRLERWRAAIPLRLHVHGTRGKTTTTRTLFAALRESGRTAFGKTTGDSPQILLPDGTERALRRLGPARVHEYLHCLKTAAAQGCDAAVFECMAISPESIATASEIFSPTHLIVTNTRPDHYETMGNTPEAIAETLALGVARSCTVFAVEDAGVGPVRQRARDLGNAFHGLAEKEQPPQLHSRDMAAAVARELGLTPAPPAAGPEDAHWPGFRPYAAAPGNDFLFLDLFSANDVHSSASLLAKALRDGRDTAVEAWPLVALLATRQDRPLRTRAFVEWLSQTGCRPPFDALAVLGWHAPYARWALRKTSSPPCLPILNPMLPPAVLLRRIRERCGRDFRLVGLGNTHGYGELFRAFLEKRE